MSYVDIDDISVLPKCWIAYITKYWQRSVPSKSDYPRTPVTFSVKFRNDDEKSAVETMEDNLNTEESIITSDMLEENTVIGNYLGTFEVNGIPEQRDLLSPVPVSDNDIGVLAFHYDQDEDAWQKIEDASIENGFVYGTLESFSPIAVFTVRRDTYLIDNCELFNAKTFVANGIPVTVYKEDDKTVVKDSRGKVTEIDENTLILGGTIDGTEVKSTEITAIGVKLLSIKGGSHSTEGIVKTESITVNLVRANITKGVTGPGFNNRCDKVIYNFKDSALNWFGIGESWWTVGKKDSNKPNDLGLQANCWVKDAQITLDNCKVDLAYACGNSGYLYTDNSVMEVINSDINYLIAAGSNGLSKDVTIKATDSKIGYTQTTNRGSIISSKYIIKNCELKRLFVAGDSTDKTVTGTVDNIYYDVSGGSAVVYAGVNGGKYIDKEVASQIIKSLKISRSTELTYGDDVSENILKDVLVIK